MCLVKTHIFLWSSTGASCQSISFICMFTITYMPLSERLQNADLKKRYNECLYLMSEISDLMIVLSVLQDSML